MEKVAAAWARGDRSGLGFKGSSVPQEEEEEGTLSDLPPAIVDVTTAVQYMVEAGRIIFHKGKEWWCQRSRHCQHHRVLVLTRTAGYPKSGLMGFCDPAPGTDKDLFVLYSIKVGRLGSVYFWFAWTRNVVRPCFVNQTHTQDQPRKALFQDKEGGIIPMRGDPIQDEAELAFIAEHVAQLRAAQ